MSETRRDVLSSVSPSALGKTNLLTTRGLPRGAPYAGAGVETRRVGLSSCVAVNHGDAPFEALCSNKRFDR
jgi:hypothetical protein